MKLLKLSSNNPKFQTVRFSSGLNIVAGLQVSESEKETYNGVGKSFSLTLIHMMFNAKLKTQGQSEKKILNFLKNYGTFFLDFEVNGRGHQISKNFKETHYYIDDRKVRITNYSGELTKLMVDVNPGANISFKNILNAFARRYGGSYYEDAALQQGQPTTNFHQNLVNFWLLGLDTRLVVEKKSINERLKKLKTLRGEIEAFEEGIETNNIKDLKDELDIVKQQKDAFVIAENYDKFEANADALTQQINGFRDDRQRLINSLTIKNKSLVQAKALDIDLDKVTRVYEEAQFFFKEQVKVRLGEAQTFHQNLMNNRVSRFESEIASLTAKIELLDIKIKPIEKSRDLILKDLSSKGALDEYNSINERIKTIEAQISELGKYAELIESFKNDEAALELKSAELKANATTYLHDSNQKLDVIENTFRRLVKRFYQNQGGNLTVTLAKDAKYLFDLDVFVPKDGSQGVNEVKIFCYDFLLYELNPRLLGFIAHDGCIFSEMDPRQKSTIFKVALDYINHMDLQYFVNIGQSSLEEVLDRENKLNILNDEQKRQIKQGVRLELYDKDPENWLFGQSFS